MPKYFVRDSDLIMTPTVGTVGDVMRLVEATNVRCSMEHNDLLEMIIIEAENKPEDAPLFGIKWEELKDA